MQPMPDMNVHNIGPGQLPEAFRRISIWSKLTMCHLSPLDQ